MAAPRKLSLRKERLTELTTEDLHRVAGGGPEQPTLLKLCPSVGIGCNSYRYCTTAPSCGCEPSTTCA